MNERLRHGTRLADSWLALGSLTTLSHLQKVVLHSLIKRKIYNEQRVGKD